MKKLIHTAEATLQLSKTNGIRDSLVAASVVESCEFNIEANRINLIRSTLDQSISSKVFVDHRVGVSTNNQFGERDLSTLVSKSMEMAHASIADEANVLVENQGKHDFINEIEVQDSDWMNHLLSEFLEESNRLFPKTIIESTVLKFKNEQKVLLSSSGTFLTSHQTNYEGFVMFTSKDGKKSSSFNYASFVKNKDSTPLMEISGLRDLLRESGEQINVKKIPHKFAGEIVLTPSCLGDFLSSFLSYIETDKLLKKQSFLQNRLDEKVASDLLTVRSAPQANEFAHKQFWSAEGSLVRDEVYLENGILRNYILNDYGARKLQLKRSLSTGTHLIVEPGVTKFSEMIKSIKKGLLVGRFSGGRPSENGDFSGIAKNSYYIENGEILFPVSEVMISGNFSLLMNNVAAVSRETINFGTEKYPWVQFRGVVVS